MYRHITKNRTLDISTVIGISLVHLLAIGAFFTFSWEGLGLFLVLSFITGCCGITFGFHRLLSHQSFKAPKFLKYIAATIGCLTLQGGPIRWVATHRLHHKNADTPSDPHSSEEGFLWSHLVWNFYKQPELNSFEEYKRLAPDMASDKVFCFLDQHFFILYMLFNVLIFASGWLIRDLDLAWSLFFWGGLLRVVYVWHITWLVNSATHYWGYKSFESSDQSRNNWWVALLTFGEGWHNNHHVYPRSAKMGFTPFEFDLTYGLIKLMHRLGLASHIIEKKTVIQ